MKREVQRTRDSLEKHDSKIYHSITVCSFVAFEIIMRVVVVIIMVKSIGCFPPT